MIQNEDGTYVYLTVPLKYNCVYTKLLIMVSDLGIDLIKDCTSTCKGVNRQVINCWNMFQAACAAYQLGEEKKANLLINYIVAQLRLECKDAIVSKPISVYIGHTDIPPFTFKNMSVADIIALPHVELNVQDEENQNIIIKQEQSIHFVIVPDSVSLDNSEFGDVLTTTLWKEVAPADGAYRRMINNEVVDGIHYTVYFFYSPMGSFKEDIKLNFSIK